MNTPYVFGDPLNPELSAQNVLFSLDSSGRPYIYNLWNPVTTGEEPAETTPQQVVSLLSSNVKARLYGKDELERMAEALTTIAPGCGYTHSNMEVAYTAATLTPTLYTITPLNSSLDDMSAALSSARVSFFEALAAIHSVAITFNPVRYLRLYISATSVTDKPVKLKKITFYTGTTGYYTAIAVKGNAATASSEAVGHTALQAFDENAATYWQSGANISTTPAYITVEIDTVPGTALPTMVEITPEDTNSAPKDFLVLGSLDEDFNPYSTFTKVVGVTDWSAGTAKQFAINLNWWNT